MKSHRVVLDKAEADNYSYENFEFTKMHKRKGTILWLKEYTK